MKLNEATLLVVDDEPEFLEIVAGWFRKEGSRVVTAAGGRHALQILSAEKVDAIVTDVRMPEMDGSQLIKRAKAMGQYIPAAVSMSGFSDLTPREAYDTGIEEQLAKPVQRKALVSAVRKSLMAREELWSQPFRNTDAPMLRLQFDSLGTAMRKRQIRFGRGGFCLSSQLIFPEASSIGFELVFEEERKRVCLQGVVRWSTSDEHLTGVEITAVSAEGRAWIAALANANEARSFIPRLP